MIELTSENYFSKEANLEFMSNSQFKKFLECEAQGYAMIHEGYSDDDSDALLVGEALHAWNEGTLKEFMEKNSAGMISSRGETKGQLKSQFKCLDAAIVALKNDEILMSILAGVKEQIFVAKIAGVMWKIKVDTVNDDFRQIVDLKFMKSLYDKFWSNEHMAYVNFVEYYGYVGQMAMYQEVFRLATNKLYAPIIVGVTKQEPPDKIAINFDQGSLDTERQIIIDRMDRVMAVKKGLVKPERCERCKYCRETKKVSGYTHYKELLEY